MLYTSNLRNNLTILASPTVRVTLTPGAGEMSDDDWDEIADHPTIENLVEERVLIPQEHAKKAKAVTTKAPVVSPSS